MAYEYAISFDIKYDETYTARYNSLMEQVRATPNGAVWSETTSFVLLRSAETIDAIADRTGPLASSNGTALDCIVPGIYWTRPICGASGTFRRWTHPP